MGYCSFCCRQLYDFTSAMNGDQLRQSDARIIKLIEKFTLRKIYGICYYKVTTI